MSGPWRNLQLTRHRRTNCANMLIPTKVTQKLRAAAWRGSRAPPGAIRCSRRTPPPPPPRRAPPRVSGAARRPDLRPSPGAEAGNPGHKHNRARSNSRPNFNNPRPGHDHEPHRSPASPACRGFGIKGGTNRRRAPLHSGEPRRSWKCPPRLRFERD